MPNTTASIAAFDDAERAAWYDADMDLMHPNRHKMADVIVDILSVGELGVSSFLDIGTGTGFLLERVLRNIPEASAIAVDGAPNMVELAKARLNEYSGHVQFRVGEFRHLADVCAGVSGLDAAVSSFALHHLDAQEKLELARTVARMLKPGAWFLIADIVMAEDERLERLTQRMRARGIVRRAGGRDARFADEAKTHAFLEAMERDGGDQPQTLATDLSTLQGAGFDPVTVFWRDTREVVIGGQKRARRPSAATTCNE